MREVKKISLIIFYSLITISIQAQKDSSDRARDIQEIKQGLNDADLVIEGKVIKGKGIWNRTYTSIFTSYSIIVYKLFKGNLASDTIEIVCRGGILDKSDTLSDKVGGLILSHNVRLGSNEEGIFFLRSNDWKAQIMPAPNSFVLWHDFKVKFLYPYIGNASNPSVGGRRYIFENIPEIYGILARIQERPYQVIRENPHDKEILK